MQYFEELHQYMLEDEGSWALSDGFLAFIGRYGLGSSLACILRNLLKFVIHFFYRCLLRR